MINIRKIYAEINDELREIQLYVHGEVGYITLECMSKEDYEALEEIAGREVCGDELCELYPIFSDTEDLKDRFKHRINPINNCVNGEYRIKRD